MEHGGWGELVRCNACVRMHVCMCVWVGRSRKHQKGPKPWLLLREDGMMQDDAESPKFTLATPVRAPLFPSVYCIGMRPDTLLCIRLRIGGVRVDGEEKGRRKKDKERQHERDISSRPFPPHWGQQCLAYAANHTRTQTQCREAGEATSRLPISRQKNTDRPLVVHSRQSG